MPAGSGATVALDGFGAGRGFQRRAEAARAAAADGIAVRVFGPSGELGLEGADGIEVIDTAESISNEDDPVVSVRSRPDASVVRAARDVAEGRSDALVSHGPTAPTMPAPTFGL